MSSVTSSPSETSASNLNPNLNRDMPAPYFNETGPIYQKEYAQGKEFVKFVRGHVAVAVDKNPDGSTNTKKEIVRFDWEAFRAAVASLQASDLSAEHDLTAIIPPTPTMTMTNDVAETTIQTILDSLVARFASTFADILFVPPTSSTADIAGGENPQTHFFNTLRKNFYHAFTHHIEARNAPERCLSFHRCTNPGTDAPARSAWEYRLLFVHSDVRLKAVRGLVMTVTLEGSFTDKHGGGKGDGEEAWHGVSLDSRGPFSGALRAMQVIVGEGFQCP